MEFGERELKRSCKGPNVAEMQTRLVGFRGAVSDGDCGAGTERQSMNVQCDHIEKAALTGLVPPYKSCPRIVLTVR